MAGTRSITIATIALLISFHHTNPDFRCGAVNTSVDVPARFSRVETSAINTAAIAREISIGVKAATIAATMIAGFAMSVIAASARASATSELPRRGAMIAA